MSPSTWFCRQHHSRQPSSWLKPNSSSTYSHDQIDSNLAQTQPKNHWNIPQNPTLNQIKLKPIFNLFDFSETQPFNFCPLRCLKYFKQVRISFKIIYYSLTFAGIIFATIEKPNDYSEGRFKITQVSQFQLRVVTTGLNPAINPTQKWIWRIEVSDDATLAIYRPKIGHFWVVESVKSSEI